MDSIELLSSSLVREYLSRKCCRNSLAELDTEFPRPENSISNRRQLIIALSIQEPMKKNGKKYNTLLEVIVNTMLQHAEAQVTTDVEVVSANYSQALEHKCHKKYCKNAANIKKNHPENKQQDHNMVTEAISASGHLLLNEPIVKSASNPPQNSLPHTAQYKNAFCQTHEEVYTALRKAPTDLIVVEDFIDDAKNSLKIKSKKMDRNKKLFDDFDNVVCSKSNDSNVGVRALANDYGSLLNQKSKDGDHKHDFKTFLNFLTDEGSTSELKKKPNKVKTEMASPCTVPFSLRQESRGLETFGSNDTSPLSFGKVNRSSDKTDSIWKSINKTKQTTITLDDVETILNATDSPKKEFRSLPQSTLINSYKNSFGSPQNSSNNNNDQFNTRLKNKKSSPMIRSTEINTFDADVAMQVRKLIFGSDKRGFTNEWTDQGFTFNECENGEPNFLKMGIVQKKGGPCGILSALQALVLKNYIFSNNNAMSESQFENVLAHKRTQALEKSITEIIWKCQVDDGTVYLAVLAMERQFSPPPHYKPDFITEYVELISCTTYEELLHAVRQHIKEYEKGRGSCILLLYSAILTHGIKRIISEMDEEGGRLLGLHGYCTQEMINLVLQGVAHSNAFDNSIRLGEDTILRGINRQSDIGLLSLFEHYESVKIGDYYKSPNYPIWLICSESHFTVIFSLKKVIDTSQFDLYYYDGLANQCETIKLTIDKEKTCSESDINGALVPPIEHCLRTKWKRASISWNDTEPIL